MTLGQVAYETYAQYLPAHGYVSGPWATWEELGPIQQAGYEAAAIAVITTPINADIQTILNGLFSQEPLLRSAGLQTLAQKVISHTEQRRDVDIEQWASRLADDVTRAIIHNQSPIATEDTP